MSGCAECDRAISCHEPSKDTLRLLEQQIELGVIEHISQRPTLYIGVDPRLNRRKVSCACLRRDLGIPNTRLSKQGAQELSVTQHVRCAECIIALAEDNPTQAVEPFRSAASQWQALNRPYDQLRALRGLGYALEQLGDLRQAQTVFGQAHHLVETLAVQLHDPKLKTSFLSSPLVQEIQTQSGCGDS